MVAKNGRAISTGSRGNFSTNTSRKAHRLGNADNCIPPPPPSEAIRDESPASMGAMGYGGVGVAFRPRLIQSEEEFTVYSPPSPRKPFSSNYFANIAKRSRQASSSSSFSPRVPINSRLPLRD